MMYVIKVYAARMPQFETVNQKRKNTWKFPISKTME